MRAEVGLLLPERRIGLSAHDFQQAIAAKEVWLTRAHKSDDAETVPSRWVIRLTNLLSGLPQKRGEKALEDMRARATKWLAFAKQIDAPAADVPLAKRPAPVPPVATRPRKLSITKIQTLIRDPTPSTRATCSNFSRSTRCKKCPMRCCAGSRCTR